STSYQLMPPRIARLINSVLVRGSRPVSSTKVGKASGPRRACSSTSARCKPTSSSGFCRARATASPNALPVTSNEALVTIPLWKARTIPRLTAGVSPKSSALTISCFKARRPCRSDLVSHLHPERNQFSNHFKDHIWTGQSGGAAISGKVIYAELHDFESVQLGLDQ